MEEEDREDKAKTITNALISFQKFLKDFKQVVKDDIIEKKNNRFDISYNFRKYNLECYIIDKKYYEQFCKAINYKELLQVLSNINQENTEKCIQMIKDRLMEENINIDVEDIEFYSDQEGLKKIVGHFNNYSFLNKELLVDGMGVPEEKLISHKIFISKNEKNTTLLNNEENFTMTINIIKKDTENEEEKRKEEEKKLEIKKEEEKKLAIKKKPKNLYYVEEITKKVFVLLYKYDEYISQKVEKKPDPYSFKNYYLISRQWLNSYRQNFLYDKIISKIDDEFKTYKYKRIKTELNSIVKDKIGQIKLFNCSEIESGLKEASKLLTKIKTIKEIRDNNNEEQNYEMETLEVEQELAQSYDIPYEFEIINEDIYDLIKKEEFLENFTEKIEKQLCYQVLFGNKYVIIKNKGSEKFEEKDYYSNELLFYKKKTENKNNNDVYLLEYILNFEKKVNFYEEIDEIFKDGLSKYINKYKINLNNNYTEEKILDKNSNILGKIFNVNINLDEINNELQNNNERNNLKISESDISKKNSLKNSNFSQINENNIINENKEEYNFNKNENIPKDDEENKNDLSHNINHKEEIDFVENIYKKIRNISQLLSSITDRIYYNINDQTELNLNGLVPDELEKLFNKPKVYENSKILLMSEDKYRKFNETYYLDELKSIFESFHKIKNKNEKKTIIEKNREKFLKFLNGKKSILKFTAESIYQLNDDFESCKNNIDANKKFALLRASSFNLTSENNNLIFYFLHKNEPYIFFKKEKIILKIKYENPKSEFCNLEIYRDTNKIAEYLKSLKEIMQNFKNKKYDELTEPINEYYLINDKWIDLAETSKKRNDVYIAETFKPKYIINELGHRYPINFFIVSKKERNKIMMENIINYFEIKQEDIVINKIFFDNQSYICLLSNSTAYFFTHSKINEKQKEKELLDLCFFIPFNSEKIMEEEITKKISLMGVELYINLVFLSNNNMFFFIEPYYIYDMNLDIIGRFINLGKRKSLINNEEYSKISIEKDELFKIKSFLTCLSNIIELRDYIPKKNNEIEIVQDDKDDKDNKNDITFLLNCLAVLRIIKKKNTKFFENIKKENIFVQQYFDTYNIFLTQIKDLSIKENQNIDIFQCLNLLIKTIILELQKQLYHLEKKKKFEYDGTKPYTHINILNKFNNEKTIIQKLFFFELEITKKSCKCEESKFYQLKYYLEFDLNEKKKNSLKIKELVDKLNNTETCRICQKERKIKKKFISLPEYLIIVVNDTTKHISTFLEKNLDIKDFCNIKDKIIKYELISFIDEKLGPVIKSNDKWRVCNSENFNLSQERTIPNLLIYKQIIQKK